MYLEGDILLYKPFSFSTSVLLKTMSIFPKLLLYSGFNVGHVHLLPRPLLLLSRLLRQPEKNHLKNNLDPGGRNDSEEHNLLIPSYTRLDC